VEAGQRLARLVLPTVTSMDDMLADDTLGRRRIAQPNGFFGRMFPRTSPEREFGPEDEPCLIELGQAMKGEEERTSWHTRAGFTYLGQFVDHDLTRDKTELCERDVDPEKVQNYRTPFLDLELVYGKGPTQSPPLYIGTRLKVGETAESNFLSESGASVHLPGGTLRDFPRDDQGNALFADPDEMRNLENVLVMQIQVLFAKFHNAAMEQCLDPEFAQLPLTGTRFNRAQQLVLWHYQRLIRQEFLSEVLDGTTLCDVRKRGPQIEYYRNAIAERGLFIPAEFSMAAFRFGHSMVRNSYSLNCHLENLPLQKLMEQNFFTSRLPEAWLVEWGRMFLRLPSSHPQTTPSSPINTTIAPDLHKLKDHTTRLFSPSSKYDEPFHPELPVRTLLRGARAHLPSGQEVADALIKQGLLKSSQALSSDQLVAETHVTNDQSAEKLKANRKLRENAPLFYYILKEAEFVANGEKLGPVGSRIVAEVFETILRNDPRSYLRTPGLGADWKLPKWRFPNGSRDTVDTMRKLIQVVGADALPQGCKENRLHFLIDLFPRLLYWLYGKISSVIHRDLVS
jgi:hypothetical protein